MEGTCLYFPRPTTIIRITIITFTIYISNNILWQLICTTTIVTVFTIWHINITIPHSHTLPIIIFITLNINNITISTMCINYISCTIITIIMTNMTHTNTTVVPQ